MKSFLMKFAAVSTAALAIASQANAATIVVNHVLDPTLVGPSLSQAIISPVSLAAGDTLDLTISFLGGASIAVTGEGGIWPLLLTSGNSATLQTSGTLEFLGASANLVAGPIALSQSNSFVHLGSYYNSGSYRLDSDSIIFSGIRQVITIDSDDLGSPRDYDKLSLYIDGNVRVIDAPAVPEPATWAMMLAGFGAVGFAMRRRRNIAVSFA